MRRSDNRGALTRRRLLGAATATASCAFLLLASAAVPAAGQQQQQESAGAALLNQAGQSGAAATTTMGAAASELPLHMTPAAADYETEGVADDGMDILAHMSELLQGLDADSLADLDGLDAENGMIRAAMSGALNKNFLSVGMEKLLSAATPADAETVFEFFPPVQKMPAYQKYLQEAAGATTHDAEKEQQAKVGAAQELARATMSLAALGASPDAVMDAVRAFTATAEGGQDEELKGLLAQLEATGDPKAIEAIQDKFLKRTLGEDTALSMADFYDTTFVEHARKEMLANADLRRIIGDDRILSLLSNPELLPKKPSDMPDPASLLAEW